MTTPRRGPAAPPPQDGQTSLYIAAHKGLLGLINKLLAMGVDVNAKDNRVPACSHDAARACTATHSRNHLIASSPPSSTRTHAPARRRQRTSAAGPPGRYFNRPLPLAQGFAPLHSAISNNQMAAVKRLMEKGADIHAKTTVAAHVRAAACIIPLSCQL
jgi:ankyrin repeat protein